MSTPPLTHRRTPSPAVQVLHRHGVTGTQVAHRMGKAQQQVAAMFNGRAPAPPRLLEVLIELAGPEVAAEAYALCPDRRALAQPRIVTRLLHAHGLTVGMIAAEVGVTRQAVHLWLSGRVSAPPEFREELRRILGEDADEAIAAVPRWRDELLIGGAS